MIERLESRLADKHKSIFFSRSQAKEVFNFFIYLFFCHNYPPFPRKRIVLLYFGRNVRTRLGVAICDVSGPPVFHIKVEASRLVLCPRTQQGNLPARSPQPPLNAERHAGKLWMLFFEVFWYDSTKGLNHRSTDCEADALTNTPSRQRSCTC